MRLTVDALPTFHRRLTVTYPRKFPLDGNKLRRDREALKKWLTRRGVGAFWYLEWQGRGAPHLHLLLTAPVPKHEIADAWYQIVGSGDERHRRAGTRIELLREPHAAAAYAAKQEQKQVPEEYGDVGRLWGHFGVERQTSLITGTQKETAPLVRIGRTAQNKRRQASLPARTRAGTARRSGTLLLRSGRPPGGRATRLHSEASVAIQPARSPRLSSVALPWEQQQGEGSRAYARFATFRDLGRDRSLLKAWRQQKGYERATTVPGRWVHWSRVHAWSERTPATARTGPRPGP